MGLRIRKSFKICKGLRINLSKSGMSVSGGVRGARISVNTKGVVRRSVGVPGTGVYYSDQHKITSKRKPIKRNVSTKLPSGRTSGPMSMSSADKIGMTILIIFFICFISICFEIIKAIF